ncbi:uncharacterized protein STEHIDRAFT_162567 [Stereum hirsutum FP-91666 SS1]|uniref:uncharacterized protein n=1 Tax=Stereum hirsutum (strain FP-91666) TaxID=721885 RepID=UPI00044498C6|nr:uncharacterized protein STEHIDRAFT_162567 [Stereum hirsutum FP-91666 SS1]EIM80800.1 hypothetical protein STEHIDRAFT_162567 [Stereum hirsutum FP-91666 SS1]
MPPPSCRDTTNALVCNGCGGAGIPDPGLAGDAREFGRRRNKTTASLKSSASCSAPSPSPHTHRATTTTLAVMLFSLYLFLLLALVTYATPSSSHGNHSGTAAPAYPGNMAVLDALRDSVAGPRTQELVLRWADGRSVVLERLEYHYGLLVGTSGSLEISAFLIPGREPTYADTEGNFLFPRTWFHHWEPWGAYRPVPTTEGSSERLLGFRVPDDEAALIGTMDDSDSDARVRSIHVNPNAIEELSQRMNYYTFTVRKLVEYFQLKARFRFNTHIPNVNILSFPRPVEHQLRDITEFRRRIWEWQGLIRWILHQAGPNWRDIPPRLLGMRRRWYSYLEREGVLDAPNRGTVIDWTNTGTANFPRIDWYLQRDVPVDWLWTTRSLLLPGLERLNPAELFVANSSAPVVNPETSTTEHVPVPDGRDSEPMPPPRSPPPSTESPRDRSNRWTEGRHAKSMFFQFWLFSRLSRERTPDDPEHPYRYGRVISWKKRRNLMDLELVERFPRGTDCAWLDEDSPLSRPMTPATPDDSDDDDEDGPFAMDTETSWAHGVTTGGGPAPPSPPGSPFLAPLPAVVVADPSSDIMEERVDYGEPSEDEEGEPRDKGKGKARETELAEDAEMTLPVPTNEQADEILANDLRLAMERSLHEPPPEPPQAEAGQASSSRVRLPGGSSGRKRSQDYERREYRDRRAGSRDYPTPGRWRRRGRTSSPQIRSNPRGRSGGREPGQERTRSIVGRTPPTEPRADRERRAATMLNDLAWGTESIPEWGMEQSVAWGTAETSGWGETSSVPTWGRAVSANESHASESLPEQRVTLQERITASEEPETGAATGERTSQARTLTLDQTREVLGAGTLLERISESGDITRRPLLDRVQDPPDVSSLSDLMEAVRLEMQHPSASDERWAWTEALVRNEEVQRVVRNRDRAGIIVEPGQPEQPVWNPPRAVPARHSFLYLGVLSALRAALVRHRYGPSFEEEFLLYAVASGVPIEYRVPLAELPPTPDPLLRPAWFDCDPVVGWWNHHPGDPIASYRWAVNEVLARPNAVRALQQGGLLWRIAMEFGDLRLVEAAVRGPSAIATLHLRGDISDLPEPSITDSLSEGELDALLGRVENGSSIWPPLDIFEGPSSLVWDGEWSFENERWFSRRRNQLVRGENVFNRLNDWYRDVPRSGGIRRRSDGVGSLAWAERFARAVTPMSRLYRIELHPEDFAPVEAEIERDAEARLEGEEGTGPTNDDSEGGDRID